MSGLLSDIIFYVFKAAVCIVLLLIQQAKQVRETPPEERSNAVYVQDISLEKNKAYVAEHILSDIFTVRLINDA